MLTPQENKAILNKLKSAGLKYQEVYEELVDHYTSAVEKKVQEGRPFEQALQEAHQEFGGNKAVKHVQKQFYTQMFKFYRNLHWKNLRFYFKWPQALSTLFTGGLVYALSCLLKGNILLFFMLSLVALVPFAISIFYFFKLRNKGTYSKNTAKGNLLIGIGGYGLNFLNLLIFVPRMFLNETIGKEILLLYPALISVIITLYLIHLLSFIRTLERVHFKIS